MLPSLLVLSAPLTAQGEADAVDSVLLVNGDRISGRLVSMTDGSLVLRPTYTSSLEIPFAEVATLSTARAVTVVLADGEVVSGELRESVPSGVLLVGEPDSGTRSLALEHIASIEPPPPAPPVRYRAGLGLAANLQRGNTWQTSFGIDGRGERQTAENRAELRARWQDAREERRRISSSRFGAAKYEHSLDSSLYAFAGGEALSDRHRDLRLRTVASLGAGYQLIDREDASFSVEGGVSYLRRNFFTAPDQDELTVRLATRLRWTLFGRIEVRDQLTLYPSFEEGGAQLRNELEVASELFGRWALKASYVLDFDSLAAPSIDELDHLLVLGLQWRWE